jgi:hypothetical protein
MTWANGKHGEKPALEIQEQNLVVIADFTAHRVFSTDRGFFCQCFFMPGGFDQRNSFPQSRRRRLLPHFFRPRKAAARCEHAIPHSFNAALPLYEPLQFA